MDLRSFFTPMSSSLHASNGDRGRIQGIDGHREVRRDTGETFETFESQYEYLDLGERVLAWGTIQWGETEWHRDRHPVGSVVESAMGRSCAVQAFDSKEEALKAVGLEE